MKRTISLLLFGFSLFSFSYAQKTALFFESSFNAEKAKSFCENEGLTFVSFLSLENAVLIHEDLLDKVQYPLAFQSEVRRHQNHLAFNRNQLIVRIHPKNESNLNAFFSKKEVKIKAHPFIENQYLISNVAQEEAELKEILKDLKKEYWVKVAQINMVHTLMATSVDDPFFDRQWSIENTGSFVQGNGAAGADMAVDSAWTISTGDSSIKIVILDSGVDTLHEDLVDNIVPGFDAFANDTSNTFGAPTPNFNSDGHGTACAGIAAAKGNNGIGVAGIAYDCKIVPIRIFYYQNYGGSIGIEATTNSNALISGSAYAWRNAKGDIMSTSAGLPDIFITVLGIDTEVMNDEINEAYENGRDGKGIAMFFSAGNEGEPPVLWPGSLANTIAIGASTMCDERKDTVDCSTESWGSSYGQDLDVVAPGTRIASTDISSFDGYSNNNYTFTFNGTSAACPNAAGVGALILSVNPNLSAKDVRSIINQTADKVGDYAYDEVKDDGNWNIEMGYGRINAFEAVKLAQNYSPSVSINEIRQQQYLNVFPNPSNGFFYIENTTEEEVNIEIFNLEGKRLSSFSVASSTKVNKVLYPGFYIIKMLKENEEVQAKQLIINQ